MTLCLCSKRNACTVHIMQQNTHEKVAISSYDLRVGVSHLAQKVSLSEVVVVPNFQGQVALCGVFEADRDNKALLGVGPHGLQRQRDGASAPQLCQSNSHTGDV